VIEIEPGLFRQTDIPYPEASQFSDPAGWDRWWLASLAQGGITDLTPIPGTWLVPLEQLTNRATLRAVLYAQVADDDLTKLDDIAAFGGGLVVTSGDMSFRPTCCGGLGAIAEWATAAELADGEVRQLDVGHPWLHARGSASQIEVSDYTESDIPTDFPHSIDRLALADGVAQAYTELAAFAARLDPHVAERVAGIAIDRLIHRLVYAS